MVLSVVKRTIGGEMIGEVEVVSVAGEGLGAVVAVLEIVLEARLGAAEKIPGKENLWVTLLLRTGKLHLKTIKGQLSIPTGNSLNRNRS